MTAIDEEVETEEHIPKICLSIKCDALSRYFREATLRIDLERQIRKLKEERSSYRDAIDCLLAMVKELMSPNFPAVNFFRERIKDIPKVTQAYYFVTNEVINLLVITEEEDFEAEMEIADTLVELMSLFKNLRFDFMIIPKYDTRLDEIVPKDSQVIFSRN